MVGWIHSVISVAVAVQGALYALDDEADKAFLTFILAVLLSIRARLEGGRRP